MPSTSGKVSERAGRVLSRAQELAQRLDHEQIGTEHILLALVREVDSSASQVLRNLGIESSQIQSSLVFIIGRGKKPSPDDIALSPRAKSVVHLAVAEAHQLGSYQIETVHLLLGIMLEGKGVAAGVLEGLGVSLGNLRSEITYLSNETNNGELDTRRQSQDEQSDERPIQTGEGLYIISVAARILEMHPQTLRKYERVGLVRPSRTVGMLRLYSEGDITKLRIIKRLVDDLGLNLAGVEMAMTVFDRLSMARVELNGRETTQVAFDRLFADIMGLVDGTLSAHHEINNLRADKR